MTTIAYDGRTLAVDGSVFAGLLKQPCIKLHRINANSTPATVLDRLGLLGFGNDAEFCYAWCGTVAEINLVKKWLTEGGEIPKLDQDVSDNGLIVHKDTGRVFSLLPNLTTTEVTIPTASGSGMGYAMGCLDSGLYAIDAIRKAIHRTTYAGIGVVFYDISTGVIKATTNELNNLINKQEMN